MTIDELETAHPEIAWREPLPVTVNGVSGLACRVCIALYGLRSEDVADLPQTQPEFDAHMRERHR